MRRIMRRTASRISDAMFVRAGEPAVSSNFCGRRRDCEAAYR